MFWKKRDKNDLEVTLKGTDRSAHRVRPLSEDPLILMIEGQPCRVNDISASGASFQSPRRVAAGDVRNMEFKLPHSGLLVRGRIRIVAANRDQARGAFLDLDEETKDQIHYYVLEVQKLRLKKNTRLDKIDPVP